MLPIFETNTPLVGSSKTELDKSPSQRVKDRTREILSNFFTETQNQFNSMSRLCGRLSSSIFPVKKEEKKVCEVYEKIEVVIDNR